MQFVIRLFPEITIKSAPVRKRWSKKLADNLRVMARRIEERAAVILDWDRIVLRLPTEDERVEAQVKVLLQHTPGIAHFSKVSAYPFDTMDDVYQRVFTQWNGKLAGKTFCVRVKRNGSHDFTSTELEQYIGGGINQNVESAGVKLKKPDETIIVEVKDQTCFIIESRHQGIGGFPLGTQEDILSLVSGGFDSTIASYMLMRRGMKTHFCFFNLGGKEHEVSVKEVAFYLWNKYSSSHRVKFISVPFEGVVSEILQKIDPSNMGVVLKRMMYRAADRLCEDRGIDAFVTGEAISQVSSQTLPNLSAIDRVTDRLVLRPLITMDKPEIISVSREIGTEEFSANIPEYCGVISVRPSAKVNLKKLEAQEQTFDFGVLDAALNSVVTKSIDDVIADVEEGVEKIDVMTELVPGTVVVDIRHPNEVEVKPLQVADHSVEEIPFYMLNTKAESFDADTVYALYCDKGVMSQLHAAHLRDAGQLNVTVYRPEAK